MYQNWKCIFKSRYDLNCRAVPVKLLSCAWHGTPLMISQHWCRWQCHKSWLLPTDCRVWTLNNIEINWCLHSHTLLRYSYTIMLPKPSYSRQSHVPGRIHPAKGMINPCTCSDCEMRYSLYSILACRPGLKRQRIIILAVPLCEYAVLQNNKTQECLYDG